MKVVKIGTALSMGLMAGFLFSLKKVHPNIELRFGLPTIVAFVVTAAVSWKFCGILAQADRPNSAPRQRVMVRWMIGFLGLSGLGTLAAFGYSLKDVSSTSRWEVIQGTGIAAFVLAIGGWLIFKAFRFFEEQSEAELEEQRREQAEREDDDTP